MKKTFLFALLFISVSGYSQIKGTAAQLDQAKKDSIENVQAVNDILTKTPIKELQEWLYKNVPAESHDTFVRMYNAFINAKFEVYLKTKNK